MKTKSGRTRTPIKIPLPLLRATYLKAAGVQHDELAGMVFARFGGKRLTRATISAVLAGDFRNEQVIEIFCEITGTEPEVMFPEEAKHAAAS
jgi:hypothetical protein